MTCAVGANGLLRTPMPRILASLRAPAASTRSSTPRPAAGLRVGDFWARTGPPWRGKYAADLFHPNEFGYRDWMSAFADVLGLERLVR